MNEPLGELFDPSADLAISEHFRPHWSQAGTIVFITFRTADSIPISVVNRWDREKHDWLKRNGFPSTRHWSETVPTLDEAVQFEFKRHFNRCREDFLDSCRGACELKIPAVAQIVADSLLHFDRVRYRLGDFVVMPNHVHLLSAFPSEEKMASQCRSWLHYTARQINLHFGRKGKFWQQEPFDHLVRSPEQYTYLREYIQKNGPKAGLKDNEYLYRRYEGE